MTVTTHEPDPDDAADDELAAKRAREPALASPSTIQPDDLGSDPHAARTRSESDDATTLAKVNDNPAPPDDTDTAAGERTDHDTVLARVNDNPPREHKD